MDVLRMGGAWRITVTGTDPAPAPEQRVVARTPYGTWTLPARIGARLDVPAARDWELTLEHRAPEGSWRRHDGLLREPGAARAPRGGLAVRLECLDERAAQDAMGMKARAGAGAETVPTSAAGLGGAGRTVAGGGEGRGVAVGGWEVPPVPEGWEQVPVPESELGPGEVRAIRPKRDGAVRAEWAAPLRRVTAVRRPPQRPEADGRVTGERVVPAVWGLGEDAPAAPGDRRPDPAAPAARRTERDVPVAGVPVADGAVADGAGTDGTGAGEVRAARADGGAGGR
ncbi:MULTISPECIES: hypothetical protein [Kitasatospora]|uniref:Uncharacterized protein n=1 Tax=Kitasatospora setae (strain ATCC 33774 / DSM 43861 / JCM 3304 / KCC A-0304 / NBRC 14216 / KM-6054) TaxID=452652 RepID=E4N3I4_KITSK|nr:MULTISPECIES: hypothetical protein [Kitasatospora]BAJ32718.1 hypothetical protein KSE_69600 [Kitasatospora setae KM-6054]